jgi:hypothetical protein
LNGYMFISSLYISLAWISEWFDNKSIAPTCLSTEGSVVLLQATEKHLLQSPVHHQRHCGKVRLGGLVVRLVRAWGRRKRLGHEDGRGVVRPGVSTCRISTCQIIQSSLRRRIATGGAWSGVGAKWACKAGQPVVRLEQWRAPALAWAGEATPARGSRWRGWARAWAPARSRYPRVPSTGSCADGSLEISTPPPLIYSLPSSSIPQTPLGRSLQAAARAPVGTGKAAAERNHVWRRGERPRGGKRGEGRSRGGAARRHDGDVKRGRGAMQIRGEELAGVRALLCGMSMSDVLNC